MDKELLNKLVIAYKYQVSCEKLLRDQLQKEINDLVKRQNESHNVNIYRFLYRGEYGEYHNFVELLAAELRNDSDEQN